MKFADDFEPGPVSVFRDNGYDHIDHDIHGVADGAVTRQMMDGNLTIVTVGDYCNHMVRCYATKPIDVVTVLKMAGWEMQPSIRNLLTNSIATLREKFTTKDRSGK